MIGGYDLVFSSSFFNNIFIYINTNKGMQLSIFEKDQSKITGTTTCDG